MHAAELAGSSVALAFVERVVSDSDVRDLLAERTFYVVSRVAPDGAEHALETRSQGVRSRRVPLADADLGPDEIRPGDGDGRQLTMRWRAPTETRRRSTTAACWPTGPPVTRVRSTGQFRKERYRNTTAGG